ncbi:MAG: hypothetical protein N2204_01795, partial [Anaerolineae bacterium]|nr:hypothetical protein [Anaerolineae bacterium]
MVCSSHSFRYLIGFVLLLALLVSPGTSGANTGDLAHATGVDPAVYAALEACLLYTSDAADERAS